MNQLADFTVGDRLVRPSLGQILNGEEAVHIEPRSMEVLVALAHQAPELFPKRELIESVWVDVFVSDEVLTHAIWDLRRAFGDDASNPEFIQTIPKRGYRLIAPVVPEGDPKKVNGVPAPQPSALKRALLLLAVLVILGLVLAVAFLRPSAPADEVVPTPPSELVDLPVSLYLVVASSQTGNDLTFYEELRDSLTGAPDLAVRAVSNCPPSSSSLPAYCLVVELRSQAQPNEIRARIVDVEGGHLVWAVPAQPLIDPANPSAATTEIKDLVTAFFDVLRLDLYTDPDIQPWFDITRNDIRAVRDFLVGIGYTYANQTGGRIAIDRAAERDPDFAAPRIWRMPFLVSEEDLERLETYLADLERLYDDARPFEKPMISWAQAFAHGKLDERIKHLNRALQIKHSRPVILLLAVTLQGGGDPEGAWEHFATLLESNWSFPGLYTAAAICALQLERLDDLRAILARGQALKTPDPETLELSILLATFDEDEEAATRLAARLRVLTDQKEPYASLLSLFAEPLAARAAAEGRNAAAERLREFVD